MKKGNTESATEIFEGLPPLPPIEGDDPAEYAFRVNEPSAMQVFFAWEKLRIVYNGILILIVLGVCGRAVIDIVVESIIAGLAANLMFCAGPVCECYLSWMRVPRIVARWVVFGVGMLIAMAITGGSAFSVMPPPN